MGHFQQTQAITGFSGILMLSQIHIQNYNSLCMSLGIYGIKIPLIHVKSKGNEIVIGQS